MTVVESGHPTQMKALKVTKPYLQDMRGSTGGGVSGGGFPIPMGGKGAGGLVGILVALAALFFGGRALTGDEGSGFQVDPLDPVPQGQAAAGNGLSGAPDPEAEQADFMAFVIGDVNDYWQSVFQRGGREYQRVPLVLFRPRTRRRAEPRARQRARSTARPTRRSTSTRASSRSSATGSARRATSPRRT